MLNFFFFSRNRKEAKNEKKIMIYERIINHFCSYAANPVKLWVLAINLLITLENKYSAIKFISEDVKKEYCQIANLLLNQTESITEIEAILSKSHFLCPTI